MDPRDDASADPSDASPRDDGAMEHSWEHERHFASAFEHAAIGMAIVDLDGAFLKVNRAACELWGYSERELLEGSFQAITHPEDLDEDLHLLRRLLAGEVARYQLEKRYRHRSGAEIWALLSVSLLRDADGRPRYFISQIQDISERKRTVEKLQETAAFLATVLDASPDMIFIKDRELRTLMCNEAFAAALGKAPAELVGRTDVENGWDPKLVYGDPERGVQGFIHDDLRALRGEEVHNLRDPANVRGEIRVFDTHKVPLRGSDGAIIGVLGVARDVTAREEAEARRLELERQVLHAQKLESLGVLAGGIAHDFNNLLTGIIGHLSLMEYELEPGAALSPHVEGAIEAASQAASLTQQMLAYSGRGRFVIEPVDLSRLIESMRRLIDVSASRSCRLELDLPGALPRVAGDPAQLRQIVMNLIINAAESTGAGGRVAVRTGARRFDAEELARNRTGDRVPPGDYVFCEVADNGSGMSEAVLARIFDPFFSTKFTGRGLGLAAALGIVRGHGGALLVASALGEGSRFTVAFPPAPGSEGESRAQADARPWRGQGLALVIDDEPAVRDLAQVMLRSLGFEVETAASGVDGVEALRRDGARVSVVLLDLTMPGLDGVATLRLLREVAPAVPVILSSGYDAGAYAERVDELGLAGVLQKPYTLKSMSAALRSALGAPLG
ncbi:MAG: PAS domain S-box protein [Myxococcales bacterium]|nr:PAS domain S-box protein [Myxococcales bacterium]